jgi:hypothetical protein
MPAEAGLERIMVETFEPLERVARTASAACLFALAILKHAIVSELRAAVLAFGNRAELGILPSGAGRTSAESQAGGNRGIDA